MLEEIVNLISSETGFIFGESLFINYYPDSPNTIVSVIDGGGFPPRKYSPLREKIIEIKLRSDDYRKGSTIGEKIMDYFHDRENFQLGDIRVLHSYGYTEVNYLYTDAKERPEFSFSLVFLVQK